MPTRRRLDTEMVRREIVGTDELARSAIDHGKVRVNGAVAQKAAHLVAPGDAITIVCPQRFVGRGGEKLDSALGAFAIDPGGWRCVDVGSSTGGFTDCLLQSGAASVVSVDVGRAQMHERLRKDSRVSVYEQTDVRDLDLSLVNPPFDLVVVDVSFIGLGQVFDAVDALAGQHGQIVVLVKPQFEADKAEANRNRGVIRDPEIWDRAIWNAVRAGARRGRIATAVAVSPITGAAGNVEFFVRFVPAGAPGSTSEVSAPDVAIATELAQTLHKVK